MDPVLLVVVVQETVHRARGEDEDEVLGRLDVLQQGQVEFSGVEAVDINEHLNSGLEQDSRGANLVAFELEEDLDEGGQLVAGAPPVADEDVDLLAQHGHLHVVRVFVVPEGLRQFQPVDGVLDAAGGLHQLVGQ